MSFKSINMPIAKLFSLKVSMHIYQMTSYILRFSTRFFLSPANMKMKIDWSSGWNSISAFIHAVGIRHVSREYYITLVIPQFRGIFVLKTWLMNLHANVPKINYKAEFVDVHFNQRRIRFRIGVSLSFQSSFAYIAIILRKNRVGFGKAFTQLTSYEQII